MQAQAIEIPQTDAAPPDRPPDIRIKPSKGWQKIGFRELWEFRHLVMLFALRDVTVRYKQTILGGLWAILQPAVQVLVFTLFFGKLMGLEDKLGTYNGKEVPYAVFVLSGQVLWNFFNSAASASSNSLLANAHILRKIYVPRLAVPLASTGTSIVDTLISLVLLAVVMIFYGQSFSWMLIFTPLMLVCALLAALSIGITLSALIVSYRDFRFVVPFMLQIWFFVTPVIYPKNILPEKYEFLMYFNPMAGVIEFFRAIVLGGPLNFEGLLTSTGTALVLLIAGLFYFARVERRFADIA